MMARDDEIFNSAHLVLHNSVILLNHIFPHLSHSDLKYFRMVNKHCLQISNNKFRDRSKIRFSPWAMENGSSKWGKRFNQYLATLPKYNHNHFDIGEKCHSYINHEDKKTSEFIYRMTRLFTLIGTKVKSLQLQWAIGKYTPMDFPNRILTHVPNVVELYLSFGIEYRNWDILDPNLFPGSDIVLPLVSKLGLRFQFGGAWESWLLAGEKDKPKLRQFCDKLIRLTPNVVSLEFGFCWTGDGQCEFRIVYLEQLLALQSTSNPQEKIFLKLDSLTLYSTSQREMDIILLLPQKLRCLDLGYLRMDDCYSQLQLILDKHANTLETIKLQHVVLGRDHRIITMPSCPRLKKLYFTTQRDTRKNQSQDELAFINTLQFKTILQPGPELFREKFPQLSYLEIRSDS